MTEFLCSDCNYKCVIKMDDRYHPPNTCVIDGNTVEFVIYPIASQQGNAADEETCEDCGTALCACSCHIHKT